MSVNVYFYIEVQDEEGKWHLVKWYSDRNFDKIDPEEGVDEERIVEIDGVKHIEKRETDPGLQCRDKLSWGRHWHDNFSGYDGLPKDISEELDGYLHENFEHELANHIKYYGEDSEYKPVYGKKYATISASGLSKMCDNEREEWIKNLKNRIRNIQLEEINDTLKRIEKKIDGKPFKEKKKKTNDEEYYEDTLEYYFDDSMWDVINFYTEVSEVMEKARMFTGNRWLDEDKVRIIYYYC